MARFNHLSLLLLRVFVLMLPCFAKSTTDVSYCDQKTDYDVKVKGVEISPTPVTRGQPATFSISATTSDTISGGKLVIEVSYFGWHVHSETHDLCAETSCPVAQGDFVVSHSQVLPGYTPPLDTGSCWFHINIAQGRVPGDGIFIENFSQLPPNRGFSLLRVHIPLR